MRNCVRGMSALMTMFVLAGTALGGEAISAGKVKNIHAEKKEFVLTDAANKEWTFKFSDKVVMNRGGKETQSGLMAGDPVVVYYDKGVLTWTARYILVQGGDSKNWHLAHGTFKNYNVSTKVLTFTDDQDRDWNYAMGDAAVRLNREPSNVSELKIGEHILLILEKLEDKSRLKSVLFERK